jgi:hypothetical protein
MNIFETYTIKEMKDCLKQPFQDWPEEFALYVQDIMAGELLDEWLESHSDEEYVEWATDIVNIVSDCIEGDDEDIQ